VATDGGVCRFNPTAGSAPAPESRFTAYRLGSESAPPCFTPRRPPGRWSRRSDGTETILGSGSANDAQQFTLKWKPSDNVGFSCGGSTVRIYLRATDPDGDQGSTYITATIGYDPC